MKISDLKRQLSVESDGDGDGDQDEESLTIEKILNKYKSKVCFLPCTLINLIFHFLDAFDDELGNTEQYLINVLNKDANACLICIETIGPKEAIWICDCCFEQFHLPCIQSWIRDGAYLIGMNQSEIGQKSNTIPWNCPKCRKEYPQSNYPNNYYCYCNKVKNPVYDPWSVPHSCNQSCDKEKACGHRCLLLCHPGPCPPCPKMVSNTCYCSKSNPVSKRCSNKYWSCNKECNHLLGCKQHYCTKICHPGLCPECKKTSIQFCKCKKFKKEVLCTQTIWQCEVVCGILFSCGHHKCEVVCHDEGQCGICPRAKVRTCPCGKSKFLKPCTEEVPTCGDTCDKMLDCNTHRCVRRCHNGPCDTCRQIVSKRCRCGAHQKELPCCTQFLCETKCNKMKNCGKHKCNKKCCDGNCTPCEQLCNKPLSCKNHKCNMLCHRGPCYPCPLQVEIFCPCGGSKLKVTCAKSKLNIKVPCRKLCPKPPDCHHEKRQTHRCHPSDCPSCNIRCAKIMACTHVCDATCHSAVRTEIIENKVREGPWEPIRKKTVLLNKDCPPCPKPVKVECFGKHEISELPCYKAKPYVCGRKCGIPLKCTHHKCEFHCHTVERDENMLYVNCEVCERECEQPRPQGCVHPCPNGLCHPGKCSPCVKLLRMRCHCATNFIHVECQKFHEATKKEQDASKSCKVPCTKNIECGHQCTLLCHSGTCSRSKDCQEKVSIRCKCKTVRKIFVCNQLTPKMLQTPIECTEKCDAKKRKSGKLTSTQQSQGGEEGEGEEEVEKKITTVVVKKENTLMIAFKKNPIPFYAAFMSLFVIFVSIFIYFYF